jgi:ribosome-associated heat shock protein Hsp15
MAKAERTPDQAHDKAGGPRLDVWLWAARAFKTRSSAKAAILAGKVQLNGQSARAAKLIGIGDEISFQRGPERFTYEVLALDCKRGNASQAALLQRETAQSRSEREKQRELLRIDRLSFTPSAGKPDKRDRRAQLALTQAEQKST